MTAVSRYPRLPAPPPTLSHVHTPTLLLVSRLSPRATVLSLTVGLGMIAAAGMIFQEAFVTHAKLF